MSTAVFGERDETGYSSSFALSFAIHALLVAVMFLGVRWQSHPPQTVSVELWEPPQPVAEPPRPAPKIEPEPPKPEPKIEKPEIVEKPAPKPKPEVKKLEPPKPRPDDREFQRQLREQLARESASAQERQIKELFEKERLSALNRARATWVEKIRAKIRGYILLPPDLQGNPEAIFDLTQLPTGEVLSVRLRKSSGHKGYDDAVERAILKSSPLPRPEQPSLFERQLELRFRPQDK